jgi:lysine biosynthesis protein LysW
MSGTFPSQINLLEGEIRMRQANAHCPICDGTVPIASTCEITEILTCPECQNKVVVVAIGASTIELGEAPEIEEDWGE